MLPYRNLNVNPKNRKTGDCSTRALVGCLGITYEEALFEQLNACLAKCYGVTDKQTMEYILKRYGYVKMKQPRKADGSKYTVGQMDKVLTSKQLEEGVFITVAGHHTCITGGCVQDIWDCRGKSVGNYYVKA